MKIIALTAALAGLLLFSGTAFADEQKKNDGHSDGHGTTQVQPTSEAGSHNMTTEEHQNVAPDDHQNMNMTPDEHQNMNGGAEQSGGHGGHEDVVETPPNLPVLGTFAAINGAFLLVGIWNKWIRKKGGAAA